MLTPWERRGVGLGYITTVLHRYQAMHGHCHLDYEVGACFYQHRAWRLCLGFSISFATHRKWLVRGPLHLAKWMTTCAHWTRPWIADHTQAQVFGRLFASSSDPLPAPGPLAPHPHISENQFMENATSDHANTSIATTHLAQTAAGRRHSIEALRRSQWLWASLCAVGTTLGTLLGARINH